MHSGNESPQACHNPSSNQSWFRDPKYQKYWAHRHLVTEWFKSSGFSSSQRDHDVCNHFESWCKSMAEYHNSMAQWMRQLGTYYSNWYQTWLNYQNQNISTGNTQQVSNSSQVRPVISQSESTDVFPHHGSHKRKGRKSSKSRKKRKIHETLAQQISSLNLPPVTSPDAEEFQMEITDELLDFFAKSAKHKREREERKKIASNTKDEEVDHVNLGEVNMVKNPATVRAPTERPGLKRTSEMRTLYGQGAAMIHGMETAMQLTFNRNCDRQQPKLWPQLPLKITFS